MSQGKPAIVTVTARWSLPPREPEGLPTFQSENFDKDGAFALAKRSPVIGREMKKSALSVASFSVPCRGVFVAAIEVEEEPLYGHPLLVPSLSLLGKPLTLDLLDFYEEYEIHPNPVDEAWAAHFQAKASSDTMGLEDYLVDMFCLSNKYKVCLKKLHSTGTGLMRRNLSITSRGVSHLLLQENQVRKLLWFFDACPRDMLPHWNQEDTTNPLFPASYCNKAALALYEHTLCSVTAEDCYTLFCCAYNRIIGFNFTCYVGSRRWDYKNEPHVLVLGKHDRGNKCKLTNWSIWALPQKTFKRMDPSGQQVLYQAPGTSHLPIPPPTGWVLASTIPNELWGYRAPTLRKFDFDSSPRKASHTFNMDLPQNQDP